MNVPFSTTPASTLIESPEEIERDESDWDLLRSMSDDEAERRALADPESPPTDEDFWVGARLTFPSRKTKISLYVDEDVLTWFKGQGKGYQTKLNAVLKAYVEAQRSRRAPSARTAA